MVNIISKNSYTVDINGIHKHISGDNMSHTVIIENDENEKDNVIITDSDSDTDIDSISLISDDENDSDTLVAPILRMAPQQPVRRHQPAPASPRRLRSGRVYKYHEQ